MLELLQTGKALYVLAAICVLGVLSKWLTCNLYKRMIKETDNMTLTKNGNLRAFKQKAETTYQMNQGIPKVKPYLERQMYDFKYLGITMGGWSIFSNQMTLWCFLVGGTAAFASYWYRTDPYFIVLYGAMGILAGLLTILVDHGTGILEKRQQLFIALDNYMENILLYRLDQEREAAPYAVEAEKKPQSNPQRQRVRAERFKNEARLKTQNRISQEEEILPTQEPDIQEKTEQAVGTTSRRDVDYLKHSLEQIAASRDRARGGKSGEEWMKDLSPEELQLIGEIMHEYLT